MKHSTPSPEDREIAEDILPWAPEDADGLAYRQDLIARAIASARAEGVREGLATARRVAQ